MDPFDEPDATVRLVCFAHAGGGATTFHPWRAGLRPDVRLAAVQLPGRENRLREPLMYALPDIVETIASDLTWADGLPFVMFGHSMGAIVAFEVARQLRREGRAGPAALLVSGKVAPHLPGRAPRIAHFPPAEVLRLMSERHGGVPAAIMRDRELVELMGNALKADLAIVEDYEPAGEAPLDCPIVAIGGDDDAWVARDELDAWVQHTTAGFSSVQFRGGHFYFRTPDVQQALLALIRETCLKASNPRSWA